MKKIYILAIAMFAFTFSNAQIVDDDMELYTLGDMGTQNPTIWSSWSNDGGATAGEGFEVTNAFGNSGQSLVSPAGSDPMMLVGNHSSGDYTILLDVYIPSGKSGYFNIQGEIPPVGTALSGVWNSGDIYFNEDNLNPGLMTDSNAANLETSTFPHDAWFRLFIYVDVDNLEYTLGIDGTNQSAVAFQGTGDTNFGGLNIFFTGPMEMYIDNAYADAGLLGAGDFEASVFSVYPNPVQDVLNIQSASEVSSVVVYDVLGKAVMNVSPNQISPSINMAELSSGVYMVNVTINGTSQTVKVIK